MSSSNDQLMATNQWALFLGSFLLAYSPLLFLFGWIVYPKPQSIIIVTSYAFCYVLSATASSAMYTLLNAIFQFNHNGNNSSSNNGDGGGFSSDGAWAAILPSIVIQFMCRCWFTTLYHQVERVIQVSFARHLEEEEEEHAEEDNVVASAPASADAVVGNTAAPLPPTTTRSADMAKFQLALNDGNAAIAAAVGFGGMHAMVLYGTLLSSEITNNSTGILYQNSCPAVPSLVVSAVVTNLFFVLQIFWMLLTFFGMRRRLLFHRGQCAEYDTVEEEPMHDENETEEDRRQRRRRHRNSRSGRWFGNSRTGGNYALLLVLLTHSAASFITMFHRHANGCYIVLPSLLGMVLLTAYLFYMGCGRIYMPTTATTTSALLPLPSSAASRGEAYSSRAQ